MKPLLRLFACCLFGTSTLFTANAQLNTEAYFKYLEAHKNMTASELLLEYPAGVFAPSAPTDIINAEFFSAIDAKYKFTDYEKQLAAKNSFMVTERLNFPTYASAYADAYIKHLPVYISSDAILHALHRSYDNMLADIEYYSLEPQLFRALLAMKSALKTMPKPSDSLALKARNDADIYLTVGLQILKKEYDGRTHAPNTYKSSDYPDSATFPENTEAIEKIHALITAEQPAFYPLFADSPRKIDFSQMTPRGHYIKRDLTGYFQAMMWFGRSEIYITSPKGAATPPSKEDIKRQCMLAVILAKLIEDQGAKERLQSIDKLITKFVGEQDNLPFTNLINITKKLNIVSPDQLSDDILQEKFQAECISQGGEQQILSQMLSSSENEDAKPAAAFMLLGQRFIFDSFVLGNVVFDKVERRLLPSPLDVMFALGNDASIQLLKPEIEQYGYAPNLAGLRYLTNSLTKDYWKTSLYSTWLSGIRSLNPPLDRTSLPRFMQTGAWWLKSMNSQLGSWAELRHDNILYSKQSYTAENGCFYPNGYVEPVPELYSTIAGFATQMQSAIAGLKVDSELTSYNQGIFTQMNIGLDHISSTCTKLSSMAAKELRSEAFDATEHNLFKNWAEEEHYGCGNITYNGIYPRLLYGVGMEEMDDPDYIIADIHTQPTDLDGNPVGNVLHVGTGSINMALVIAKDPADGCSTAYVGPVGSYFEHIEDQFNRLDDQAWAKKMYLEKLPRPTWVNSYLANDSGKTKGESQTLFLGGIADQPVIPASLIRATFTPNPMSSSATVAFEIPARFTNEKVTATIYSPTGMQIRELTCSQSGDGKYTAKWDGLSSSGELTASGVYLVRISIGESSAMLQCTVSR